MSGGMSGGGEGWSVVVGLFIGVLLWGCYGLLLWLVVYFVSFGARRAWRH